MAKKSSGGKSGGKSTGKGESEKKPAAAAAKSTASSKPASVAKGKASAGGAGAGGAGAKRHSAGAGDGAKQAPLIDTNLAASAAAAMILNRAAAGTGQPAPATTAPQGEKKESAAFKNLKDSLNKPAGSGLGGILGNTAQQKKSNLPFGGGKQVGRNQTFGADVNRSGVPRRTPG